MKLEPGAPIGDRYTLVSRLGSGGMADVWLAEDSMLERRVALKFLHERFAQDAQFVERFRREAQSAAGLQHPNVVGVYDRGEYEGRHWIAMEYVEGAALNDLIERGLSVPEAIEIVRQVLLGAKFAHERGIIHRDLKPQNVLVDRDGRARVTDFGIARAGASEITQTGSVLGTAQYLSPEQAQGLDVTATADLYSIGVILYEALTGQVPFEADSAVAVALKQVSEHPRPPSQVNPRVTPALDSVVLRALAKDPANRFQNADEFLRALDAAEADPSAVEGTAAYAPVVVPLAEEPEPESEQGWLTRRRLIALAVLALLAAAVAAWALTRGGQTNVPSVVEQDVTQARSLLERRGFDVTVTRAPNCATKDTVVEQDPPAGSKVDEGSEVTLTASLGLNVKMPVLKGKTLAEARKQLDDDNLLVQTKEQGSRKVPAGRVIRTDPPPGENAACGSKVTLFVSKGENLVKLPDVLGEQEDIARDQLERLDFIVNIDTRDADQPEGTVIVENPGPGSSLPRGETVTLVVSTGAGSVLVPDVAGQSQEAAIANLKSAGLSVVVQKQVTDEQSEDGRVIDQAPTAGERVKAGDSVTIVVGDFEAPETTTTTTEPTTSTSTSTTTDTAAP